MSLTSRSPRPPSRRPRRRASRAWLPVLVVLGMLGGAAGWGIVTGSASLTGWSTITATERLGASQNLDDATAAGPQTLPNRETETNRVTVPAPQVPDSSVIVGRLPPVRSPLIFTDLPDGYWAKPYVDALTARGVLNGLPDGTFAPNRPLSRAELATQIANAFEMAPANAGKAFSDLPIDYWATEPINRAVVMGFMTGYPAGDFRPDAQVSRLQVLVALATGLALSETTESRQQLPRYQDWETVPAWARQQVGAVIQARIIQPNAQSQGLLRPQDPATRAEVAALVYASLVYLGDVEALPE
ncbi:MAG: S-layer homology domain-containing protein [Cyanobacteria bacterium P01_H01_bin.152]